MAVGDVVELPGGLVGVIGEQVEPWPARWRVYFKENALEVLDSELVSTLSAPSYQVGDAVSVWPDHGTIQAINGDEFSVQVTRSAPVFGNRWVTWTATLKVPRWRIIRDNDQRISPTVSP